MGHTAPDPAPASPPTDDARLNELAEQARRRDAVGYAAFEALFERFNGPICDYLAYLLRNTETAHDLAQDTFFAAWQALPETKGEMHFRAWLYRIATNKAYSYLRRQKILSFLSVDALITTSFLGHEAEAGIPGLSTPGPEEQLAEAEMVAQTLARLSPKYRMCVLLQDQAGFSQREIAQMLGISEKTVSAYVSRGRQQFLEVYERLHHEEDREPGPHPRQHRAPGKKTRGSRP